ncbi:MAG: dTDP-4-dehydrorhamnose 3,5-epimerase [Planctomycetaceae bacterium]|nr:dTDP-4-dehydrorhamnose 3,5-epimerase [Planctomycetaceae bacterium]
MNIIPTRLPDVLLIEPVVHGDHRGFFMETYHQRKLADAGLEVRFVQDNLSRSQQGILRGLHYQIQHPQGKFVSVVKGEIFDVAVDLRRSSPTFGRWVGERLSEDNRLTLYVPEGFAHGFCVLSEVADVLYKCTDFYFPEHERTLSWNDPDIGINWPLTDAPILSAKDKSGTPLAQAECFP